jgi:transmembrane sensor
MTNATAMDTENSKPIAPAVLDQAMAWFVTLSSGTVDAAQYDACTRWRRTDPEHERAWQRLQRITYTLQHNAPADSALSREVLTEATEAQLTRRQLLHKLVLALGVFGSAGWLARDSIFAGWHHHLADQRTATGEQRTLALNSNSQLLLDSASAVNLDNTQPGHQIELVSGRLMLTTVNGATVPPVSVVTADGVLRPNGTQFTVRRYASDQYTRLAVIDGEVTPSGRARMERGAVWRVRSTVCPGINFQRRPAL